MISKIYMNIKKYSIIFKTGYKDNKSSFRKLVLFIKHTLNKSCI